MKIYKGTIISCDSENHVYRYLAEDRGKILFTGDHLPDIYAGHEIIELGTRAMLPGFIDTHIHFSSYAFFNKALDVTPAESSEELARLIEEYASKSESKYILGFGVSPYSIKTKRMIGVGDLDEILPDRPLMIVKYDGHACVVNRRMLEKLPKKIKSMRGFDRHTGLLTQEAFFAATQYMSKKISPFTLVENMLESIEQLAERGISMIHAVEGIGFFRDMDVDLVRLVAGGQENPFQIRVFFQTMDIGKVVRRKLPRIGGCFDTALDGCFGSVDAALSEPYRSDPGNKGVLFYSTEAVTAFIKRANRAGLQVQVHAIGDAAFDQAVSAFETALDDFPREDHRHTIIHAALPTMEGLEKCARFGIALAVQPAFIHWDHEPVEYLESVLGDRIYKLMPLKRIKNLGILMGGGSDAPCTNPDPIAGIHSACNHYIPEQSLSIMDALKLFTIDAARLSFDEKERGSLEPGKIADMVILDKNPLQIDPADLSSLRVERILLSGEPYQSGQRPARLVWNGLKRKIGKWKQG